MARRRQLQPAGEVCWAGLNKKIPSFAKSRRKLRGALRTGLRYEHKAQEYLSDLYPGRYVPSPWIVFSSVENTRPRWIQPDGLLIDLLKGIVYIVEIKYRHCAEAWFQLTNIYQPVVSHLFPSSLWDYRLVEVVSWFDGSQYFPGKAVKRGDIEKSKPDEITVHIWRPS